MSKVIDSGSLKDVRPWNMPQLCESGSKAISQKSALETKPKARAKTDSDPTPGQEQVNLLTAEKIAEIQAQAYREGFDQGRDEGRKAGLGDMQSKAKQFERLMTRLAEPFAQLDAQVEQELLALVSTLTGLLVRREIRTGSGQILQIVHEALHALPVAAREVKLYLHPDDAALVRDSQSQGNEDRSWRIVDDHLLSRGDCRVVSDTSQIDATLETRLQMLISTEMDGEAAQESES